METDIEAEVSSALALIENLSIKSSDSGLSEDTCWQLFGGPCPEALRKRVRPIVELEEPGDIYFSAEDVLQVQAIESPTNQSTENSNANRDIDELQSSKEKVDSQEKVLSKEQSTVKVVDSSNESNRVLEKFRNFNEVMQNSHEKTSRNPSLSDKIQPESSIEHVNSENNKVSSITRSVVEAFERVSGPLNGKAEPNSREQVVDSEKQSAVEAFDRTSKHSVNSQKGQSSSSGRAHYSDTVTAEENLKQDLESSRLNVILSKHKNSNNFSAASVNMKTPSSAIRNKSETQTENDIKKSFSNKSNQINFLRDNDQQTVGVSKQSSGLIEKKDHTMSSLGVQKNLDEAKSTSDSKNEVAPETVSPTTSSLSSDKPIRQIYSSMDSGESSEYDSSIISDLYKRSKCRNDNLCTCRCCVERRIQSTYSRHKPLRNNFTPSQKPLETSNKKIKINIFEDNIPKNNVKGGSGNFIKITSFADNILDTSVKRCNKRLQTSKTKMQEEPLKRYHSVYIPCNANPLYQDPVYTKPQNAKNPRKPTKTAFKCCGDYTSKKHLALSSSSSSESGSLESDLDGYNYTRLEKDSPNIADSLRSAIKNRNTVRETVSKFEERNRCSGNFNHQQQKSRFIAADICSCCNRPRNDRSRAPRLPMPHLPKYNQW